MVPANTASWAGESEVLVGNIADSAEMQKLADLKPDVIFQLASIVSGEAELEFIKGWQVNMAGSGPFWKPCASIMKIAVAVMYQKLFSPRP